MAEECSRWSERPLSSSSCKAELSNTESWQSQSMAELGRSMYIEKQTSFVDGLGHLEIRKRTIIRTIARRRIVREVQKD